MNSTVQKEHNVIKFVNPIKQVKGIKSVSRMVGKQTIPNSKNNPFEYDFNEYYLLSDGIIELNTQVNVLKLELEKINSELFSGFNEIAVFNGGDFNMEELREKIHDIQLKVAILEERTKKIDTLPTKDEFKNIINDVLNNKKYATKIEIENEILKYNESQRKWNIGIIITSIATAATVIGVLITFINQ